jgi:SAM-dependent methyltransferase
MDRMLAPLTTPLLARAAPQPGERVLDVGCGAGAVSLEMARLVGRAGRVLAVDISRPLLERARERATEVGTDGAQIEWQEADAGSFSFPSGGFDLIVSRFGTMFFPDPVAAFRNLRTALRPGGRLVMLCWRSLPENAWVVVPRDAVLTVVPPPPPPQADAPGPFAFADAARVQAILGAAGFVSIRNEAVDATLALAGDTDAQAEYLAEMGPASRLLQDADAPVRQRAVQAIKAAISERAQAGRWSPDGACWLFVAQHPD